MPLLWTNDLILRAGMIFQTALELDVPPPGLGRAGPARRKRDLLQNARVYAERAINRHDCREMDRDAMRNLVEAIHDELDHLSKTAEDDIMSYPSWQALQNHYKDVLIFLLIGDFYETFDQTARTAYKVLDTVLTGRSIGNERHPMTGFPARNAENYVAKLIAAGYRVGLADYALPREGIDPATLKTAARMITPADAPDLPPPNAPLPLPPLPAPTPPVVRTVPRPLEPPPGRHEQMSLF